MRTSLNGLRAVGAHGARSCTPLPSSGPKSGVQLHAPCPASPVIGLLLALSLPLLAHELDMGDKTNRFVEQTHAVKKAQIAADDAQTAAEAKLAFIKNQQAKALELQKKAREAQKAANDATAKVEALMVEIRHNAIELKYFGDRSRGSTKKAKDRIAEIERLKQRVAQREKALEQAKLNAKKAAELAKEKPTKQNKRNAKTAAGKVGKTAKALRRDRKDLGRAIGQRNREMKGAEGLAKLCRPRWARIKQIRDGELQQAMAEAKKAEQAALTAQTAAILALKEVEELTDDEDEPNETDGEAEGDAELSEMTPSELYEEAKETEERITEEYVEARAAELATISEVTKELAKERIDVPEAEREDVDTETMDGDASTPGEMEAFRGEAGKALDQVDAMIARGQELLQTAGGGDSGDTSELSADSAAADAEIGKALEEAAADGGGDGDMKDLTELMEEAYGASSDGGTSSGGGAAGGYTSKGGSLYADQKKGSGKSGKGVHIEVNPYDGVGKGPRRRHLDLSLLKGAAQAKTMFSAVPGRRIQKGVGGANWMYIDSWYMVGPFPNDGRRYMERKFPPESVVDLDAVYEGKDKKQVRWKFTKVGQPVVRFKDSYSIYYAYTELWFDEPTQMWIVCGADDGSRLYLNNMLIWRTTRLKAWKINEAYRKVSFKKGLNRILYRVENAPAHGWFSFLLFTGTPKTETK